MNTGDLLNDLADTMSVIDEMNTQLSAAKKQRAAIEAKLRDVAEQTGLSSFSNDRITVSLKEDFVAGYDPDQWNELVAWAVETGNLQLIQRRISTKPVKELIDNGCEIPAGVRLEPTTKVNVRRK